MHRLEEKSKQIIEGSRRSAKISVIELSEKKTSGKPEYA